MDQWSIESARDHFMLGVTSAIVSISGSVVRIKFQGREFNPPPRGERGEIGDFSRAARKRLLVFMARIDWSLWRRGSFVTFGYPDDVVFRSKDDLNDDRYLLHRWIEEYTCKHVQGIWRTEWEPRKSGEWYGYRCPHHHWLLLNCEYIPFLKLREKWQSIIASKIDPSVRIKRVNDPKHAGHYIGKYVAKLPETTRLGIPPYLNKPGRHYGFFWKDEIPLCDAKQFKLYDPALMILLEELAAVELSWINPGEGYSFDVFGEKSLQIRQAIVDFGLDKFMVSVDDI